ncbi:MAG: hypothetical protein RI897_2793 [Verrucomicrobiota bacterium]
MVEVEESEAGEVTRGEGGAAGSVIGSEGHEAGVVFTLEGGGEEGVEDVGINILPGGLIDVEHEGIEEECHVVVVVIEGGAWVFEGSVAGGLVAEVAPGDVLVFVVQGGIEAGEFGDDIGDGLVEGGDFLVLEGEEEEVGIEGFGG